MEARRPKKLVSYESSEEEQDNMSVEEPHDTPSADPAPAPPAQYYEALREKFNKQAGMFSSVKHAVAEQRVQKLREIHEELEQSTKANSRQTSGKRVQILPLAFFLRV